MQRNPHWNWPAFFEQYQPITESIGTSVKSVCRELPRLSYEQGLHVIVTSVPGFDHEQWQTFCQQADRWYDEHPHAETWLTVGALIRDGLEDIWQVLSYDIEQAVKLARRHLASKQTLERLAWLACLRHYGHESIQARMMFDHLLPMLDDNQHMIQAVHDFYKEDLTNRQQEVARLASYGYTNQEIAATLGVQPSTVAEQLTEIYAKLEVALGETLDQNARRYRLIHWLTRLFERRPHLLDDR